MTKAQYLAAVDSVITDQVAEGGITPTTLGTLLAELGNSIPFNDDVKEYWALLTQENTDIPVATILKNTTGVTFTFTYEGTGAYDLIASSPVFTADKTCIEFGAPWGDDAARGSSIRALRLDSSNIRIRTYSPLDLSDLILRGTLIKITILP